MATPMPRRRRRSPLRRRRADRDAGRCAAGVRAAVLEEERRAAGAAGRDRDPGGADSGVRPPRSEPPAVRQARFPRRPGADLAVQGVRRHLLDQRRGRRREFPRRDRPELVAARAHHLCRHAADRHRRRRDGADARARRAHARGARAGTTPRRWRATAARSMSASSACTGSCGSISARKACWRAARPIEVPAAFRSFPNNGSVEALAFVPRGSGPLGGTLIAIAERGRDRDGNHLAFLIGGPRPGAFTIKRRDDYDVSDATILPGGDLVDPGAQVRLDHRALHPHRGGFRSRTSGPARWSMGRCCSRPISASRSTTWKGSARTAAAARPC